MIFAASSWKRPLRNVQVLREEAHPHLKCSAVEEFPPTLISKPIRLIQTVQDVVEGISAADSPESGTLGACNFASAGRDHDLTYLAALDLSKGSSTQT